MCFACCRRCLCPNLCGDGYTFANSPHDRDRSPAQMKIEAIYKLASIYKTTLNHPTTLGTALVQAPYSAQYVEYCDALSKLG